MFFPKQKVAEIDLQKLAFNLSQIKSLLKPGTKIMPIIKANAYGHGAVRVAQKLEELGVEIVGVSCVYEVMELRLAGVTMAILNLGATFEDEFPTIFQYNYIPTIFSLDIAQKLSKEAVELGKKVDVHIKVETGMGRIGVDFDKAAKFVDEVRKLPNINVQGLFTHFANADNLKSDFTKIQVQRFTKTLQDLKKLGIKIPLVHAANSAGTLFWPESHFDLVRVGKSLYGDSPSDDESLKLPVALKPILKFKTYITFIKTVPAETPISYGCTFHTKKESTIITIPIGYGDGFRRTPKNFGEVLVGGKKVPIVGRVCMDQSMADASDVEGLKVGDEVVVIGSQGNEEITAKQIARKIETNAYEVLVSISGRVRRTYLDDNT